MTSPSYSNLSSPLLEHPSIRKVELVTAVAIRSSISPIPEALGLTWTDTFYDSTEGVIAVFDINYTPNWVRLCFLCVYTFVLCVLAFPGAYYDRRRTMDVEEIFEFWIGVCVYLVCCIVFLEVRMRSRGFDRMHVAVTNEGIRKDFPIGVAVVLTTVVIPFEEIKAINCRRGSSIVTVRSSVDRASDFIGLEDPEAFIALVNAMMARSHTVSVLDEESLTEK